MKKKFSCLKLIGAFLGCTIFNLISADLTQATLNKSERWRLAMIVDRIERLKTDHAGGQTGLDLSADDVNFVFNKEIEYLSEKERERAIPKLAVFNVPIGEECAVIGDQHGELAQTKQVFNNLKKLDGRVNHLIFLGDYVDRGLNSLEVILYLYGKQMLLEGRIEITLLRGNHELSGINQRDGFLNELMKRFKTEATSNQIWQLANRTFNFLPLMGALFDGRTKRFKDVFVHAGIGKSYSELFSRDSLMRRLGEISDEDLTYDNEMILNLLWSDPDLKQLEEFKDNSRGIGIKSFNKVAFHNFTEYLNHELNGKIKQNLINVFRGHQCNHGGFFDVFGKVGESHLYTVFSCFQGGQCLDPAYVVLSNNPEAIKPIKLVHESLARPVARRSSSVISAQKGGRFFSKPRPDLTVKKPSGELTQSSSRALTQIKIAWKNNAKLQFNDNIGIAMRITCFTKRPSFRLLGRLSDIIELKGRTSKSLATRVALDLIALENGVYGGDYLYFFYFDPLKKEYNYVCCRYGQSKFHLDQCDGYQYLS